MLKTIKYSFLHIFLPLFFGGVLYVFGTKYQTGLEQYLNLEFEGIDLPDFMIFQLPDALWAYAFTASFLWIWNQQQAAFTTLISFLFCSFYEILQLLQWINGTFDWWDILAMGIGCLSCFFFNLKF